MERLVRLTHGQWAQVQPWLPSASKKGGRPAIARPTDGRGSERVFRPPVRLGLERREIAAHGIPLPSTPGKDNDLRGDGVRIFKRSDGHGHEPGHLGVPPEERASALRAEGPRHDVAGVRVQAELRHVSSNLNLVRCEHRSRRVTGPAQSLAVDAVAVRNDNRIALDFVRDRAAEASSSSHDSLLLDVAPPGKAALTGHQAVSAYDVSTWTKQIG